MQAGRLDRRLTILRRTLSRNSYGEQIESFDPLATVWAQKLDVTGREFFAAQKTLAENTTRFRIRWRDDLSVTDRISCGGHEYDIKQLAELGRADGLEIVAVMRDT